MKSQANLKNKEFYRGKRVFVTGHTGYKGAWLTAVLHELGAETTGYALRAPQGSLYEKINGNELIDNFEGDMQDYGNLQAALRNAEPEIVFHLAAQAIVKDCYDNPVYTYQTNVMGTVNLLEAIRTCPSVKSVVVITTDKVYENKGDGAVYAEEDRLGGIEPYSSSKTCMEYIVDAYKHSYLQTDDRYIGISTVRASNVLGGGDHVQSRLIPSILQSISFKRPVELRHPNQTRPWQSMMDALNGYLCIGRMMYDNPEKYSGQWNIGPTQDGIRSVLWVVEQMRRHYVNTTYIIGNSFEVKESETLGLDITKSLRELDWEPLLSCDKMLFYVVDFFKRQQAGEPEWKIVQDQIHSFYKIENDLILNTD